MEKADFEKADFINSLYSQREKFILIGLTGRTGAGCSTVANILSRKQIKDLDLRSYKTCDYNNSDERKYSVIYRYMKEGDKWKGFTVIEASSIIFSFVLQDTYGRLFDFIDSLGQLGEIKGSQKLKERIVVALSDEELSEEEINISDYRDIVIDKKMFSIIQKNGLNRSVIDAICLDELLDAIDFFTVCVREKKEKFRKVVSDCIVEKVIIKAEGEQEKKIYNFYSFFMQILGNNIRSSGKYDDKTEIAGKEIIVADRINSIVRMIRRREEEKSKEKERTRICIDALRNSVEIQYFRDRYRAFYTFAVNTEDVFRQNRLGLNKKEMQTLDEIEYPDDNKVFFHQNIQACMEIADIYLYNPNIENRKYYELTEQILKYIALILQPGLVAPTHLERCMQLAFNAKYNSGCLSRQVGAVVTGKDFSVRAVGWNDVPKGQVPCNLRCVEDYCRNKDEETFSEYELNNELFDEAMGKINGILQQEKIKIKKAGKCYAYCFKDIYNGITGKSNQVHTRALHAEENAFLQIAKYGGAKIQGGKLFTTASPCELCSKKAYQLGIKEIYYIDPYPGISKSHILTFGRKENPEMIFFQGAIGNAYISLYAPRMPYKDEIELTTGISTKVIAKDIHDAHKDDI
ncbi:MAG: dCMP deaminase [Lachnospiraceae bacterium]|nr:dCMP deaminase [Lachnospiraceae bacterium]